MSTPSGEKPTPPARKPPPQPPTQQRRFTTQPNSNAVVSYAPEKDGETKLVSDWTTNEVWAWLQTLPYAARLTRATWEYIDGGLLSEASNRSLEVQGVPGPLIPRMVKDIHEKVVEIERMRIEAELKGNEDQEAEAARKRQASIEGHRAKRNAYWCFCIPRQLAAEKIRREYRLAPGEEDIRHEVRIQIFVNSIGKIDSSSETWQADFWLRAVWADEHLFEVRGSADDFRADWEDPEWFQPRLEVVNSQDLTLVMEQKFVDTDEIFLEQRWRGTMHSDMDLHAFPFDQQELRIDIESSFHATKFIKLTTAADDAALYSHKCTLHSEFRIDRGELDRTINKVEFVTEDDADFERYSLILHVSRRSGFYIGKVGLVNLICVIVGCSVAFISPEKAGNRLAITTTMFLTLVAFQMVIASLMPKIGYFTLLDYLVLVCYAVMMGSCLQALVQYQKFIADEPLDLIFQDDYDGFITQMAVLMGMAILLSLYGVKSYMLVFAQRAVGLAPPELPTGEAKTDD